jgi:hypothetical protein
MCDCKALAIIVNGLRSDKLLNQSFCWGEVNHTAIDSVPDKKSCVTLSISSSMLAHLRQFLNFLVSTSIIHSLNISACPKRNSDTLTAPP